MARVVYAERDMDALFFWEKCAEKCSKSAKIVKFKRILWFKRNHRKLFSLRLLILVSRCFERWERFSWKLFIRFFAKMSEKLNSRVRGRTVCDDQLIFFCIVFGLIFSCFSTWKYFHKIYKKKTEGARKTGKNIQYSCSWWLNRFLAEMSVNWLS